MEMFPIMLKGHPTFASFAHCRFFTVSSWDGKAGYHFLMKSLAVER